MSHKARGASSPIRDLLVVRCSNAVGGGGGGQKETGRHFPRALPSLAEHASLRDVGPVPGPKICPNSKTVWEMRMHRRACSGRQTPTSTVLGEGGVPSVFETPTAKSSPPILGGTNFWGLDPQDTLEGGGGYPPPSRAPSLCHCPPDGNCQPRWHL